MSTRHPGAEPAPTLAAATSLRTAAGSPLLVEVTVTNTAAAPRVLAVGVLGVEASWVSPQVRTPALQPGESTVVTITLTPAIGTVPAQYPLAFTAQALDPETGRPTGTSAAMVDSALVVNPRNQLRVSLEPRDASLIATRKVKLTLHNDGEQPARVAIGVQASPRLLVRFRSREVDVLPGATREVRGRIRVPRGKLVGGRSTYSYTVSTRGTESVRHVEGSVTQHALIGTGVFKVLAVVAALSIWITAAIVFVPQLADRLGGQTETTATVTKDGADDASDDGPGDRRDDGADDGAGDGGSQGGSQGDSQGGSGGGKVSGGKSSGGAQQAADRSAKVVAFSGTVTGRRPGGVTVRLEQTSLVDEEAQRGVGIGTPAPAFGETGMSLASAFLNRAVAQTPPKRTARTAPDGTWAFTEVRTPGFYLLTFSKPGYQSQSFVVDSSSEAAAEPLTVDLVAGEGRLSGTVTGPDGAVGAATVTITDGTNTITTSSNSRGDVGRWSVSGLSTPGTYVVQVSKPGLSSEARMVELGAGGSAVADLRLRHGVATLVGKARAVNELGEWAGVGGVQVSVASADGEIRTATTLTQGSRATDSAARVSAGFAGTYTISGLPAPGDYVVTISGDGLQTQTSKVTVKRGQSRAVVDADLVSASGSVAGTITGLPTVGAADGLVGVGLTLSNAENTYKTMSTSEPKGGYLFNGVAPGTYTLRSEYFGYSSDDVAVTVRAGRTAEVHRQLEQVAGGVLAARSSVHGRVVDATTALPVDCASPTDECLVASVLEPGVDDGTEDDRTYETRFLPSEEFTLPDSQEDPGAGLLPGVHTVQVSAPHYSSTVVKVQVGSDSSVDLGTLSLLPAPKIAGFISTATGVPDADTCIWAVPASDTRTPPSDCQTDRSTTPPGSSAECQRDDATFGVGETGRVCAFVEGTGRYSIEVPTSGSYTFYVMSGDDEYVVPEPAPILLESGVTRNQSVVLNRLGRLFLTVVAPNSSGVIAPLAGATVTLDPSAGPDVRMDPPSGTTDTDGTLEFYNVPAGTYRATATLPDPGGVRDDTTGFRENITVGLNQQREVRITATEPLPSVVGQVSYLLDGVATPLPDVSVRVIAPTSYNDSGAPQHETLGMTTNASGCFVIERTGSASPAFSRGGCTWPATTSPDSSRGKKTFVSNVANRVEISRPGFAPLNQASPTLSVTDLNAYTLDALPISLGLVRPAVVTERVAGVPLDWSTVTFTVQAANGPAAPIQVTGTGTGDNGQLSWFDTRINARDKVLAGTYTVRAHREGYRDGEGTVRCEPISGTCQWVDGPDAGNAPDVLTLTELSTLHVAAQADGATIPGAQYTLRTDGGSPVTRTGDEDGVTFTGLDPTQHVYTVQVRVAGYGFSPALACPDTSTVLLRPGLTTECVATMTRLGTITGKVTGTPERPPGVGSVTDLSDADVSIYRCTDTTTVPGRCAAKEATPTFTGTTDENGEFSITGTLTTEGISETGAWLVQATSPGYSMAAPGGGALPGALVTAGSFTDHVAVADLPLVLTPVGISVTLRVNGAPFTGATVELWRYTESGSSAKVKDATVVGSTYRITGITPGTSYYLLAYGGGLLTATQDLTVETEGQTVTMPVTRASNYVQGTVTAPDRPGGVAGATVSFCTTATCATTVTMTDGSTSVTTNANGFFSLRTVPDGSFYVRVVRHGYLPLTGSSPIVFNHLLAPPTPLAITLVPKTRQVVITVSPTWSTNDLTGTQVTLTDAGGTPLAPVPAVPDGDGAYVATFNQVRWGCWTVDLQLPPHHYGTPSALQGGPTDSQVPGCTGPKDLVVPGGADDDVATASVTVDEGRVDISTAATPRPDFPGHVAGTVRLVVTRNDTAVFTDPAFPGSRTVWLPSGGGYEFRAQRLPTSAFWPDDVDASTTVPATKPSGRDGEEVELALVEEAATVTVTLTGALDSTVLVLTPPEGESIPTSFSGAPFAGATTSFALPAGEWRIDATSTGTTTGGGPPVTTTKTGSTTTTITAPGAASATIHLTG